MGNKLNTSVIFHRGTYKPAATVADAVFMITGMTIGAGILAIPYAVAQVGLAVGILYIVVLGALMLFLNLMIGEIAINTNEQLQLVGFAGKYLGKTAKYFLTLVVLISAFGALLVYIIGEGSALSALFGGSPVLWSIFFWSVGSFIIWSGLKRVKTIDKFFGVIIMAIISGLCLSLLPKFDAAQLFYFNGSKFLLPLGVVLFALNGTSAIAEAHALLPNRARDFRKALIIGTLIPISLYILFALAVVGFTGQNTTEIATVGLGRALGPFVSFAANLFAALAMCTGFIGLGTALRETLVWDHKLNDWLAIFLVVSVPLALFLLGFRNFIIILDVLGIVTIASETLLMAAIYYKVKRG